MNITSIREQSADQIVTGYLAMIHNLPKHKRLDALADVLMVVVASEIRRPLLREFNNLMGRENT